METSVQLLLATRNPGKIKEMRSALLDLKMNLKTLDDFPPMEDAVELNNSYEENAIIKATHYARQTGLNALADDSGLEVEALGGRPGVMSARYGGANLTDHERVLLLLSEMQSFTNRAARFVCAVAVVGVHGTTVVRANCTGRIGPQVRGTNGFGYDPVFIPDNYLQTFAEIPDSVKNRISHRSKALAKAKVHLFAMLP